MAGQNEENQPIVVDDEEGQFVALDDVAEQLKVTKGTLYYYIKTLKIKTKKYPLDRRAYMPLEDVNNIKKLKARASRKSGTSSEEKTDLGDNSESKVA